MTAPPGQLARASEPGAVAYQAVRDTDLTTRRGQQTYLMDGLGLNRLEATDLIRAFQRDQERPLVTSDMDYAPSFIDWLMRQAPTKRKPSVKKWQLGQAGWRTAT